MKIANDLLICKQTRTTSFYESSFKLVSTLLTEVLGRNCQRICISAKSGNFIHDPAAKVESTGATSLCVKSANVIEREQITEILIDGSIKKDNRTSNNFSIFFTMKRQFLAIPQPCKKVEDTPETIENICAFEITGMLYNSIFTLSLSCIDNTGCQSPLGTGRGYLIFDEEQRE